MVPPCWFSNKGIDQTVVGVGHRFASLASRPPLGDILSVRLIIEQHEVVTLVGEQQNHHASSERRHHHLRWNDIA